MQGSLSVTVSMHACMQVNGPFTVNQLTGVITLSSVLDYDVAPAYTLNIRAQVCEPFMMVPWIPSYIMCDEVLMSSL